MGDSEPAKKSRLGSTRVQHDRKSSVERKILWFRDCETDR